MVNQKGFQPLEELTPPDPQETTPATPPPSYESLTKSDIENPNPEEKKCCRRKSSCAHCCFTFCSFYGLFCFFWSVMTLVFLCMTIGYFVSVVDTCVNPPVTMYQIEYIDFSTKHPNLSNLTVYLSVVSGSIKLKTSNEIDQLKVEVIRGASTQENIEKYTSVNSHYNSTHLSIEAENPSSLTDCPTTQIIITVPEMENYYSNRWLLSVETGQVHIESFVGLESIMEIHLTTGAVHIDDLKIKNIQIVTNAGAVFWKDGSLSDVSGEANILTNSGYIDISELSVSGSLTAGTNTGVVNMKDVTSSHKLVVDGFWGVIHLTDCTSPTTFINSDSAHICFTNYWANSLVYISTESGTYNTDNLSGTYQGSLKEDGGYQIWFPTDEETSPSYFYISTVSGTVTLSDS